MDMSPDQFHKADLPEDAASASDDSASPNEDASPIELQAQEVPRAEGEPLPPRPREQALPEKDDDRFFDRWVVDKARILGGRAVRQPALDKLRQTIRTFAEWRSLRHETDAETANQQDKALVAATPERIKNLEAEAARLNAQADERDRQTKQQEAKVEEAAEKIADLQPALRGSAGDRALLGVSNAVVFGVDFYVIQVALETIPGGADQRRFTAAMLGLGAVLVGDILGWMAAVGTFRRDGSIQRPRPAAIATVAGLLILSIWFFGELGAFREFGLRAAEESGPKFGSPTFFTVAQILFLIGASVASFGYFGRRTGRELNGAHEAAVAGRNQLKGEVDELRAEAEAALRAATAAPALRLAAEERIRSRERIAAGKAKHDLKQGEYLENLVVPEYMRERAAVESGIYRWKFGAEGREQSLSLLGLVPAIILTLAAGGIAYWVVASVLISVVTAAIVAAAFALAVSGKNEQHPARQGWQYVAQLFPSARKPEERASDIERLVAEGAEDAPQNGGSNGNGRGKRVTKEELLERIEKVKEILEGESE
jgi:hypothetical protein